MRFFAALREAAGTSEAEVSTSTSTLGELYGELQERFGFPLEPRQIKVSRNLQMAALSDPFSEGDSVVFLPPVAGG